MQTQSSDEIMRETENTRAGIEKNLDALEDRLAPGEVLDQIGRAVEPARDGAARFARNLGDTVRDNPVPAAMVGIGLGWLLLSQSRSGTAADRPAGRVDPSRPADRFTEDPVADGEHPGPGVRARQAREWARERAEGVRDSVGERAEDTYRRVSDTAHRAGARAGDTAAAAGNFVQRRPILTGVAVAGLGAVIAAALFARTDRGERLVSRAADAGRDAAHRMGETVRSAAQARFRGRRRRRFRSRRARGRRQGESQERHRPESRRRAFADRGQGLGYRPLETGGGQARNRYRRRILISRSGEWPAVMAAASVRGPDPERPRAAIRSRQTPENTRASMRDRRFSAAPARAAGARHPGRAP